MTYSRTVVLLRNSRKFRNLKALRVDDGRKRVPCGDVTGTAEARVLSGLDPLCL